MGCCSEVLFVFFGWDCVTIATAGLLIGVGGNGGGIGLVATDNRLCITLLEGHHVRCRRCHLQMRSNRTRSHYVSRLLRVTTDV